MYLQVGYGLEGAIPDATAKTIIEREIKPRFGAGDFDAGLTAGVNAILQAARGEYQGTGRTVADQGRGRSGGGIPLALLFIVMLILIAAARRSQGTVYRRSGRSAWTGWPGGWGRQLRHPRAANKRVSRHRQAARPPPQSNKRKVSSSALMPAHKRGQQHDSSVSHHTSRDDGDSAGRFRDVKATGGHFDQEARPDLDSAEGSHKGFESHVNLGKSGGI